jgi:predicted Zn-dependent protease
MVDTSVEGLYQSARQALAQRDLNQARQLFMQALALKFDDPDVQQGLATCCFLMQDYHNAAHHFREVTRLDPLRAGAYVNLGAVYNRLDLLDEAIQVLRRGIQIDTHQADGYYNLALVYRRKGQLQLAVQAYLESLRINPRHADAHYNLANLYFDMGRNGQAIGQYREALKLRPGWQKAEVGLAEAEAAQSGAHGAGGAPVSSIMHLDTTATGLDPDRVVDPNKHGSVLTVLHKVTIDSDTLGRRLLEILETQLEPAIKELSACLLIADCPLSELDERIQKFEKAIQDMRGAQRSLQSSLERIQAVGDQLVQS